MPYKQKIKRSKYDILKSSNDPVSLARKTCITAPGKETCLAAVFVGYKGNTN